MASPYIKQLMVETGKLEEEVTGIWNEARTYTSHHFEKEIEAFGVEEFDFALLFAKKKMGLDEHLLDVSQFLGSKLSARQYIEDTSVALSAQIGKDPVVLSKNLKNDTEEPVEEEVIKVESTALPERDEFIDRIDGEVVIDDDIFSDL